MLFWRPHPDTPLIFYAISGLWGVGDAVWQTQINGKYLMIKIVNIEYSLIKLLCFKDYMGLFSEETRKQPFQTIGCGNHLASLLPMPVLQHYVLE